MTGNRWIEIDTDAIRHNYAQLKNVLADDVRVIAVVKADAYGLGAAEVSRVLEECGAAMLAVTTAEEGIELRQNGLYLPVLLLSPFLPAEADLILQYDLTPSISSLGQVQALEAAGAKGVNVHLKIETGLGRTGLLPEELPVFLQDLAECSAVVVDGVFTHFAQAKQGDSFTRKQFALFQEAIQVLHDFGYNPCFIHACNSTAALAFPEMHCTAVRVGTLLFGQRPAQTGQGPELRDPFKAKARVVHIRDVAPGTSIGYGREYLAKKTTWIAVIPLGWADGLTVLPAIRPKNLLDLLKMAVKLVLDLLGRGRQTEVQIKGKRYHLVGRLGMQLSMAAVDQGVEPGDEVQFTMRRLSANPRLPRIYSKAGQVYAVRRITGAQQNETEYCRDNKYL